MATYAGISYTQKKKKKKFKKITTLHAYIFIRKSDVPEKMFRFSCKTVQNVFFFSHFNLVYNLVANYRASSANFASDFVQIFFIFSFFYFFNMDQATFRAVAMLFFFIIILIIITNSLSLSLNAYLLEHLFLLIPHHK